MAGLHGDEQVRSGTMASDMTGARADKPLSWPTAVLLIGVLAVVSWMVFGGVAFLLFH
ncbi:hypothetical protein [Paracraurococcus lichenis]|uniref:Uncharacterized protein n=1 Tax=Paracraurococcus lichenis TaxID=3064888 RepID=A0ABT9ECA3_9PROT|nr:hypothetical protein [Paracraurococcus sp. LOR1-02]MDO9713845.1 hypothetical protein [Paracraurococcus sp. LOR1-02]